MKISGREFKEVWFVDFEFYAPQGEQQLPLCLVAYELESRRTLKLWRDQFGEAPPYSIGRDSLFVAYYASAELGCHLTLDWPMPVNVLDLFAEFRNHTNGKVHANGSNLLGALAYFNIPSIEAHKKEVMRELAMRGGPYTDQERKELLDYCQTDVFGLAHLFGAMAAGLDIERALLRGRYMAASAHMEFNGIPIDHEAYKILCEYWESIQEALIPEIDKAYGVYEGTAFRKERFKQYLVRNGISWPMLDSGNLDLSKETFKDMSKSYPQLRSLYELRVSLSQLRLKDLAVGSDGRNRCLLSAFRAKTGRNAPSSTKYVFGPATWLRGLIKPSEGNAIAYVDWSQQEFGIAAALSKDERMLEAYRSGDPYLAFAKQAGAAPPDATKESHRDVRDQFKACVLAVNYGMGSRSLSNRINRPLPYADQLLKLHQETYGAFREWSNGVLNQAYLNKKLWTVFGWNYYVDRNPNPRSLRNWPVQSNGAEMLRLAVVLLLEAGVKVCVPVHDAVLIEASAWDIKGQVEVAQRVMEKASSIILGGFALSSDAVIVRHPERYMDRRGEAMWTSVWTTLNKMCHLRTGV